MMISMPKKPSTMNLERWYIDVLNDNLEAKESLGDEAGKDEKSASSIRDKNRDIQEGRTVVITRGK